ncbi:MAG: GNAT family N-acetyltransferase [Pseudomonadota bacterium]
MTNDPILLPITATELPAALALLPQLADFEVPPRRDARDLYTDDGKLLEAVVAGNAPNSYAEVAVLDQQVLGVILVTMRPELMSHAPSAHLEAIVVSPEARGRGLGRKLLQRAQESARARGAASLSLHVFANNHRARALYDADGFDSELIRAIKWLD